MNSQQSEQSPLSRLSPLRSIGVTVGSGIVVTGILFTAISIIALLGFYSFQKVLHDFSERILPLTAQEAQNSILISQLLQQTNILQNADSQQKRRIAFDQVKSQLSRIATFNSTYQHSLQNEQHSRFDFLNESIHTLNEQIGKRIQSYNDLHTATNGLIIHTQHIHSAIDKLLATDPPPQTRTIIKQLKEQAVNLITQSLNEKPQVSLYQLKEKAVTIHSLANQIQETITMLPPDLQVPADSLVQALKEAILGENGTLSLEQDHHRITNNCAGRAIFIRNLLENKGNSSMTHFFELTTSVTSDSKLLSDKVYRQIEILSVLFIFSLVLAIGFFFYFQRFLIQRLTNLNKTVLAMVAGENLQIEEKGRDEITAIAHSINYFTAELHKAKSLAEKSAVQKSEFLAHMSHEIRTPLNAILGFSDLALKTNNPAEHLDYLSKINGASHSLLGIINSILNISKMEAGKFTIDRVEFDLRNLLEELSSIISLKCEESGLHFYYNIEPDVPYKLIGDPLRLSQVLTNLVANAFKFTEEGNITIHISAKSRLANWKNKTTLLFSVQDTGTGISEAKAAQLFQPFTQADTSITRKFGGTGLGLAICKNLVEMMGGDIWLKQNETKGSTFSFTSTFEIVDHNTFYECPEELTEMSAIVMSRTPQSATELSIQLEHFGFRIFQTLSIDEILAKIQQNNEEKKSIRREIIFIDCDDMALHWQEAVRSIKEVMSEDNMSPLILTGSQRLSAHFLAQDKQASDYFLISPITPSRLLEAITTVIDIANPHSLQNQSRFTNTKEPTVDTRGGTTILLVEDNEINSQIAAAYLKSRNLAVIVAHNGAEALEILLSSNGCQINAILMDIQMPVMDGYTATKAIRKLDTPLATIPIVALTAHAMSEERQKCLTMGMDAYLTKPINESELFHILDGLLGKRLGNGYKQKQPPSHASLPENLLAKNSSLNMKTGLAQVMNDPALYMDLLMSFVKRYKSWPAALSDTLESGDLDECRRLVHTLKGVSGNLGMEKLFSLCARLELHLRGNEHESIQQVLNEIKEETDTVCDFLSDWLKQNRSVQHQPDESSDKHNRYRYNIADLTEALFNSLKNNSSKALKQVQLLKSQLGEDDAYVFNKIEQHAKELDFAQARDLLIKWQQQ